MCISLLEDVSLHFAINPLAGVQLLFEESILKDSVLA